MSQGAFAERGERPEHPRSGGVFSQQGIKAGPFRTHTALEKADQRRYHSCFTGVREHKSTL